MNNLTDLLRPFAPLLASRSAMAVGFEAKAVGRFLQEAGAVVTMANVGDLAAIEGCEPDLQGKFDFIVWTCCPGVSNDTALRLSRMLKRSGFILMTIDNPLGFSRMRPGPGPGKREVAAWLTDAGLSHIEFCFAFPDVYNPEVLLRERAFQTPCFDVLNLVGSALAATGGIASIAQRELMTLLVSNGLMSEHSNSFFLIASPNGARLLPEEILGYTFNASRSAAYNKFNVFYQATDKSIKVRRTPYEVNAHPDFRQPIVQVLAEERYVPGRLYSLVLESVLAKTGWSLEQVCRWAKPYLELLKGYADEDGFVDGRYMDLTPFNLLLHEGSLTAVDLEWKADRPVLLRYVFFRGLYHTLARAGAVRQPAPGTPINLYGLCLAVSEKLFGSGGTIGLLETFLELEPFYFGCVFAKGRCVPCDRDLVVEVDSRDAGDRAMLSGRPEARECNAALGLYPLLNCNLQVFVEGPAAPFSEETSTIVKIGLLRERRVYSIPLAHFTGDVTRLRIDPSDHTGLIHIHSVDIRTVNGAEIYHWTPHSRAAVQLSGLMVVTAAPGDPEPVAVLLNGDPMLIFPLPVINPNTLDSAIVLEVELSALDDAMAETMLANLSELCRLIPDPSIGAL